MNCRTFQDKLLRTTEQALSEETRRHLQTCSECAAFQQTLRAALNVAQERAPSQVVDARIRQIARNRIAGSHSPKRLHTLPARHTRQAWYAVAALLLFSAFLAVLWLRHPALTTEEKNRPVAHSNQTEISFDEELTLLYIEMEMMQIDTAVVVTGESRQWRTEEGIPSDRELQKALEQLQGDMNLQHNGS